MSCRLVLWFICYSTFSHVSTQQQLSTRLDVPTHTQTHIRTHARTHLFTGAMYGHVLPGSASHLAGKPEGKTQNQAERIESSNQYAVFVFNCMRDSFRTARHHSTSVPSGSSQETCWRRAAEQILDFHTVGLF